MRIGVIALFLALALAAGSGYGAPAKQVKSISMKPEVLNELYKEFMQKLLDRMEKLGIEVPQEVVDKLGLSKTTRALETALGDLLQQYVDKLKALVAQGQEKYQQILAKGQVLLQELHDHVKGIAGKVVQFIRDCIQILGVESAKRSIEENILETLLQGYIDKLKALVAQGQEKYEAILEKAKNLLNGLQDHAVGIITKVKQFLVDVVAIIGIEMEERSTAEIELRQSRQMETALGALLQKYIDLLQNLVNHGQQKFAAILAKGKELLNELQHHATGIISKVRQFIADVMQILQGSDEKRALGERSIMETALGELLQGYINILQNLVSAGQEKYAQLLARAKQLLEELKEHVNGAVQLVKNFIVEVTNILGISYDKRALGDHVIQTRQMETALGALLQKYIDLLQNLVNHGQQKFAAILAKGKELLDQLQHHATGIIAKVRQFIADVMQILQGSDEAKRALGERSIMETALGELLQGYINILQNLVNAGQEKYAQLLARAKQLLEELKEHVNGAIQLVKNFIVEVTNILGISYDYGKRTADGSLTMSQRETALADLLQQYINILKGLVAFGQQKYQALLERAQKLMDDLKHHVTGVTTLIAQFIKDFKDIVLGGSSKRSVRDSQVVVDALTALMQKYVDILKALVAAGQEKYEAILEKAQALLDGLKHHATGIINKVKEFLSHVVNIINGSSPAPESEQEMMARSVTETVLGNILQKYIDMLKVLVAGGQEKYEAILEKAQQLMDGLKHHAVGIITKVKNFLADVMQILGLSPDEVEAKRSLDKIMDHVVDEAAEEAIRSLIAKRGLTDIINSIQGSLQEILNALTGHFKDLKDWLKQWVVDTAGQLKPHTDNIKFLAQQFLEHINNASDTVKQEALKFFEAHKKDLGALWEQIQQAIQGNGN
jgi:ElaB/YqjD/DUF883 family membrane-anchored ribosome-binding protein